MEKKRINWKILVIIFSLVYFSSIVGSIFIYKSVTTPWYQVIKPSIAPPDWVFPVVWSLLFFLIALSLYLVWIKSDEKQKLIVAITFGINLSLNILWSFFFFFLKNPLFALIDVILLVLSIILIIYVTLKINKKSAWLLVPYLLWVIFAGILNFLSIS
jgi:translocator protein